MNNYKDAERLYHQFFGAKGDTKLPPIQLAHFPISDTELAACIATMGVPFREPGPYTDEIDEGSGKQVKCFWLGERAPHDFSPGPSRTDELSVAWQMMTRFVQDFPLHPLVAMWEAIEARRRWISAIAKSSQRAAQTATSAPGVYATDSLREASVLVACRYECLGFTGRAFLIRDTRDGVHAKELLAMAACPEGASPAQWMWRALINLNSLLKVAKEQRRTIGLRDGESTLYLSEDATPKTVDKFQALL